MKKLVALALSLVMLISAASTALAYSPEDPITISFWHTRGSGANYEVLKASVDAFNETVGKEKGIIVEEIYQGNYNTNVTKIQLGSQSGDIPVIAVTSSAHTAVLSPNSRRQSISSVTGAGFLWKTEIRAGTARMWITPLRTA